MGFLRLYGKEIVALLVPLIAWTLNTFLRARARIKVATSHAFTFLVQQPLVDGSGKVIQPNQVARTRSILIHNVGRETATKVQVVLNWKPMCINVWPSRHFTEHVEPDGRYVLLFDSLSPGESFACEVLVVNADLPDLVTVRSDQSVGQFVEMLPQPVVSARVRFIAALLVAVGMATSVYWLIVLIQFLVLQTPGPAAWAP